MFNNNLRTQNILNFKMDVLIILCCFFVCHEEFGDCDVIKNAEKKTKGQEDPAIFFARTLRGGLKFAGYDKV